MLLKISQISLEKCLLWSLFSESLALRPATLLKRDSNTSVFLGNLLLCKISNSNNLFKNFSTFTYQKLVPIERLNINNFAVFLHF